jgi:hypothetical protein
MNPSQSKLFEAIGLSAIVISLIFVAYQILQSNRIARGTTSYELSRNWMEVNRFYMTEPEMLSLRVKLEDKDFVPESDIERQRTMAYARMLVNMWTALEEAHENGIASDAYYKIAQNDVRSVIRDRPGFLPYFGVVLSNYDNLTEYEVLEPFREAVEQ